jgi:hypothetical protein
MPERRFPPPWCVEQLNDACFIVKDSAGQIINYELLLNSYYFE